MARDAISLALGENAAFQKFEQGCKHMIEGATEISTYRSDPRWMAISIALEKIMKTANDLHKNSAMRSVKGMLLK